MGLHGLTAALSASDAYAQGTGPPSGDQKTVPPDGLRVRMRPRRHSPWMAVHGSMT
jgi:hypothetical protein